jgi:hypothetical protein
MKSQISEMTGISSDDSGNIEKLGPQCCTVVLKGDTWLSSIQYDRIGCFKVLESPIKAQLSRSFDGDIETYPHKVQLILTTWTECRVIPKSLYPNYSPAPSPSSLVVFSSSNQIKRNIAVSVGSLRRKSSISPLLLFMEFEEVIGIQILSVDDR